MKSVLLSIQSLLAEPNPDDPLNNKAADEWKSNKKAAEAMARELTLKYAKWFANHFEYNHTTKYYFAPSRIPKNRFHASSGLLPYKLLTFWQEDLLLCILFTQGPLVPILLMFFYYHDR